MIQNILLAVLALCVIGAALVLASLPSRRHLRNRKTAERVYSRINGIQNDNEDWLRHYLQKIDPYVFEELILLAFSKKGYRVKYNRHYSGDGGIDGRVFKGGRMNLIQAKRYTGYIDFDDVLQFCGDCRKRLCNGYFVTTGKVGKSTLELVERQQRVTLVYGKELRDLFIEDK